MDSIEDCLIDFTCNCNDPAQNECIASTCEDVQDCTEASGSVDFITATHKLGLCRESGDAWDTSVADVDMDRLQECCEEGFAGIPEERVGAYGILAPLSDPRDAVIFDTLPQTPVPATFTCMEQFRPGTDHASGGRKRDAEDSSRVRYVERCQYLLRRFVSGICDGEETCAKLILSRLPGTSSLSEDDTKKKIAEFCEVLQKGRNGSTKGVQLIYGPAVAVCAQFSASATVKPSGGQGVFSKSRERHTCCTWIGIDGNVRCTCIGSTEFRVRSIAQTFVHACCHHAMAFTEFLVELGAVLGSTSNLVGATLTLLSVEKYGAEAIEAYRNDLPLYSDHHGEKVSVLAKRDFYDGKEMLYVPLRCVSRGGDRLICAFCDLARGSGCEHVLEVNSLRMHGGPAYIANEKSTKPPKVKLFGPDWDPMMDLKTISTYPLGLVNCKESLRVDRKILLLSQSSQPFLVSSPKICVSCSSARVENSRRIQEGIVLCTGGPCRMHVEVFKCSNMQCAMKIHAEGRDEKVLISTLSTAATHVLLRKHISGVALSNGTVRGRLREFHSECVANVDADLIPGLFLNTEVPTEPQQIFESQLASNFHSGLVPVACIAAEGDSGTADEFSWHVPKAENVWKAKTRATVRSRTQNTDVDTGVLGLNRKWRSTRDIQDIIVAMCKLMVVSPPASLFHCTTCETGDRLHALCADGIWSGCQKKSCRRFVNVGENIKGMAPSTAASASTRKRPLPALLRRQRTGIFMISAIKGSPLRITNQTVSSAVSAIRLVNDEVLPPDYFHESICGSSPKDYSDDLGNCTVQHLRDLCNFIFNEEVICLRLCRALLKYLQTLASGRKINTSRRKGIKIPDKSHEQAESAVKRYIETVERNQGVQVLSMSEKICWSFREGHSPTVLQELLMLFCALIQAPAVQLVTRFQVSSLLGLSDTCQHGRDAVLTVLAGSVTSTDENNVLRFLRILRGGLLCAAELEQKYPSLLKKLGICLQDVANRVDEFYTFYSSSTLNCTATAYAKKWDSRNYEELRAEYLQCPLAAKLEANIDNCYATACRTGAFFPGHPQVRPLPFNDDMKNISQPDVFGVCSKNYVQKRKSFSPGALTFCCSCSLPIIMGFKMLEKNEGPRAVLDIIVSRFPMMPRHIVYDFACGLFASAVHTLWWAIEDTTITSDSLHALNHNCAPSYYPTAHDNLNMTNTVAHEQRNRAISEIEKSLRYTSQEFYIALLAYQICILNLKAKGKGSVLYPRRETDVSEHDLEWVYFHCLKLKCPCC